MTEILKQEHPFYVVIRKLPIDTPTKDTFDLEFPVIEVSQMNGRSKKSRLKIPHPLFLVTLTKRPDNHQIYNLKYLLSYKVDVEQYRPPKLLQCYNCQQLGHSQKTCFSDSRCIKCGAAHPTNKCEKPRDIPAHCSKWNGDHPANYRGCTVLKTVLNLRRNNKKKEDPPNSQQSSTVTVAVTEKAAYLLPSIPTYGSTAPTKTGTSKAKSSASILSSHENTPPTSLTGLGATIRDIFLFFRELFQGLNLMYILNLLHQGLVRNQSAPDKNTKIAVIVEIIFSALDDGSQ